MVQSLSCSFCGPLDVRLAPEMRAFGSRAHRQKSLLPLLRIQSQPRDHLVCRLRRVKQTFGLFGTCDRKQSRIEQSNLHQKRRLIPVDMLVRNATGFVETHHDDMWQHNLPTCRRHARKVDAHFAVVSKADNQLVDDTILTDSARQRFDVNVVRPMANEMVAIEALYLQSAGAARQGRNVS